MRPALLIAMACCLVGTIAAAQEPGWSPPHKIATRTTSNWFPSVAIDPWGDVHLVWSSGTGDGSDATDLLMYSSLHDGQWSNANDIMVTGKGGWAARNSLAVDRTGRLHLLLRSRDAISYTSAPAASAWSAASWTPLHKLNGLNQPYYSSLVVDSTNVIHAVWEELAPQNNDKGCDSCSDLWYRSSHDGGATWDAPIDLSNGKFGAIKPQLVMANDPATLYVVWDEGKDPNAVTGQPVGIAFVASHDGGATWNTPVRMKLPDDALEQAALGVDGKGRLVLVCRAVAQDTLLYLTSTNGGHDWSKPTALPGLLARSFNDTPWDHYSIAMDSRGNLHLLAVARQDAKATVPGLYHVTWDSVAHQWSAPDLIVANDQYPEWPQVVVAGGNEVHATWFTRSPRDIHDSDHAAYQVWYSERTVDAPATVVEVLPTPTPVPAATEHEVATAIAPAALPPRPIVSPPPEPVRGELPTLRYLGLALLPATVLLGGMVLSALRRRLL